MDQIDISELDFFKIKQSLIDFFDTKPEFTDHDFEGTALNALIEALAYEAHYVGAYTNLGFSESFLDSAVQRASIVSRSHELGYLGKSVAAPLAIVNMSFSVTGNPNQHILPKATAFTGTVNDQSFSFVTTDDILFENDGNDVFSRDIEIYQGAYTTRSFTVNTSDLGQAFELGTDKADTRFLSVGVKSNSASFITDNFSYNKDVSISELTPNANIYFLKENYKGLFEVYFGDGVIARELVDGNVVELDYLVTEGKAANGIKSFSIASSISGLTNISITTVEQSASGADKESKESISYNAPLHYQAQNRAVTETDYLTIMKANYANIDDVKVWGGERNDPPFYGKVFIAIKPSDGKFFSNSIKQVIQNDVISKFNIVGIRPEIVDPDYIDVAIKTTITYNTKLYNTTSQGVLENQVRENVDSFFENESNKFAKPLYYSKLVAAIDETSNAILNSITNLTLSKSVEALLGINSTYTFAFNNSLHPGAIKTNEFTIDNVNWKILDTQTGTSAVGVLKIYRETSEGTKIYLSENAGSVDYNSGKVTIDDLRIDSIVDDTVFNLLTLSVVPGSFNDVNNPDTVFTDYNVYANDRDQIIRLADNGIDITLLPDETV